MVEVNAEKFLALWRNNPHEKDAGQISWRADRKYPQAEEGFSYGARNPVPLARPHVCTYTEKIPNYSRWLGLFKRLEGYEENSFEYIGFTNGVARTLWLLENGVKVFPIECRIDEARDMQRAVGAAGGGYMTVDQLLPM